ncbi:MAG: hypothetical protein JRN15_16520 [Nitrososphaerota archaeon]|nr:hypothetical protein [Nitrososphaerota archaeon]
MKNQTRTRKPQPRVRACSFCKFVREFLRFETLGALDEEKYLRHLKIMHGFEP